MTTEQITETIETKPNGMVSVLMRQGEYAGWALRKTEDEARAKAMVRLQADREGWFR